jgi:hypothetical protein
MAIFCAVEYIDKGRGGGGRGGYSDDRERRIVRKRDGIREEASRYPPFLSPFPLINSSRSSISLYPLSLPHFGPILIILEPVLIQPPTKDLVARNGASV